MKVHNADIVISAVSPKQYPDVEIPEIALAGRSNVGKSSFINTLINRKNLARTSSKPGKTQTLNFYIIEDKFHFVDVPGYGYAKVSKSERAKWGQMIETYLTQREQLRAVICLVDIRHKPSQEDIQMYQFLKYYDIPAIVVATKADKVPKGKWNKHESIVKKALDFDNNDAFILFSSETKKGKEEAWVVIEEFLGLD
ncbi:ribosome biogenesis GTP-binding protein YihA/YsxC [Vagococcus intermedius]|uniref:Probable GTP-binding protein EngB n=1 Tax=Vagococcus intermedius TaxID=2991418 RepID=A0AAF0CVX7_9ENTE|nr:ribosome biogenesis GTP-binding protein YihA/YsxC [Vagococcus intermedius]WEG73827.1 ribosome biogenesis GTP-binding protein YihA/YsxC [Vagococcus intermedius]WEG75912.1 ribosome biogenesis GTP-binding protein YihA/YsxC [Vagococcus intermedius]